MAEALGGRLAVMQFKVAKLNWDIWCGIFVTKGQCYKTFYGRNLLIFVKR
jgi:hypothetical protein